MKLDHSEVLLAYLISL